jgi:hypothetical protein
MTELELVRDDTGQLVETEIELPIASLPTAVTAALAGKGAIHEAEVVVRANGVIFEVEVGDTEYTIDPAGKILGQEIEADGDEQGDDED